MNDARIVMTTCARQPAYVEATLESLFATDRSVPRIHVVVSERDATCLGIWEHDVRVRVYCWTDDQLRAVDRLRGAPRTSVATRVALDSFVDGPVILLQDDLAFAPSWYQTTLETVELVSGGHAEWTMLALYSPFGHVPRPFDRYEKRFFYGCQALYLGTRVRMGIVQALARENRLGDQRTSADDVIIGRYVQTESAVQLFAMNPSVVQHVGRVSGIGSTFHQSPTFARASGP